MYSGGRESLNQFWCNGHSWKEESSVDEWTQDNVGKLDGGRSHAGASEMITALCSPPATCVLPDQRSRADIFSTRRTAHRFAALAADPARRFSGLSNLLSPLRLGIGGELVEGRCPSDCPRGIGGNASVSHHHLRTTVDIFENDGDLGGDWMPIGHAHL